MGAGDWADQNGEYYRHPFGNALLEKAFKDYEYKKVLEKGLVEVDGQKYKVDQDVYATLKKGTNAKLSVTDGKLVVENGLKPINQQLDVTYKVTEDKSLFAPAQKAEDVAKGQVGKKSWLAGLFANYQWLLLFPILLLLALIILLVRLLFSKTGTGKTKKKSDKGKK